MKFVQFSSNFLALIFSPEKTNSFRQVLGYICHKNHRFPMNSIFGDFNDVNMWLLLAWMFPFSFSIPLKSEINLNVAECFDRCVFLTIEYNQNNNALSRCNSHSHCHFHKWGLAVARTFLWIVCTDELPVLCVVALGLSKLWSSLSFNQNPLP